MKVTFPSSFVATGKLIELVGVAVVTVAAVLEILDEVVVDIFGADVLVAVDEVEGIDVVASSTTSSSSQLSWIGTTPGVSLSTAAVALA